MPRFSLRPSFLRRLSSKHSASQPDSTNNSDNGTDTTAATSASRSPSPSLNRLVNRRPRKSSSVAKLRDKLRSQDGSASQNNPVFTPRKSSLPGLRHHTAEEKKKPQRSVTSPPVSRDGEGQQYREPGADSVGAVDAVPELDLPSDAHFPPDTCTSTASQSAVTDSPSTSNLDSAGRKTPPELSLDVDAVAVNNPRLVLQEATPDALGGLHSSLHSHNNRPASGEITLVASKEDLSTDRSAAQPGLITAASPTSTTRDVHLPADPNTHARQQSLVSSANEQIVRTLIDAPAKADRPGHPPTTASDSVLPTGGLYAHFTPSVPNMAAMLHRKIWVKRPNASATLVQIREDDLVDDVRDMILKKYANSLGKTFDAPDMTLRIVTRADGTGPRSERLLGPEEEICRTIDTYYPGGQTVEEALVIDVPHKRTPRPSPRNYNSYHAMEDLRPQENGTDYFPPMPAIIQPTIPSTAGSGHHHPATVEHPRSISVLNTGQVPPLPSPGGRRHRAEREHRPKYGRQHTSSPTILSHTSVPNPAAAAPSLSAAHIPHRVTGRPRVDSSASEAHHHPNGVPASAPPLPTPPAPDAANAARTSSTPPTPSSAAPGSAHVHRTSRPRKTRKPTPENAIKNRNSPVPQADPYGSNPALPNVSSMLDGSVPPINVLIVEDNIINLRILEGLMKRLKVRWQTAMNGQIAVDKWKNGGYHLVLMDIQMPIMNGLQATKEIRRLERVNGIGVFSSSSPGSPNDATNGDQTKSHNPEDDRLASGSEGLFKSPVIIVALTASSLQSDRHEALAAGCNDFLTKPVSFVWLERKVKEWGCMQALIDFDGWRKWKDYAAKEEEGKSEEQKKKEREAEEKQKVKMEKMAKLQEKQRLKREQEQKEKEAKAAKRESLEVPDEAEEGKG